MPDSTGIVDGPASLDRLAGDAAVLTATAPGPVLLRLRFSDRWAVTAGDASLKATFDGWTELDVCRPGEVATADAAPPVGSGPLLT